MSTINPITPDFRVGSSVLDELDKDVGAIHIPPPRRDTITPPADNSKVREQVEAEIRKRIEAELAAVRQKRESLEKQLNDLAAQFADLPWYAKAGLFLVYEGYKIAIKIQIASLSLIEKMSPQDVLAAMKSEIDKFVADFEKVSSGNPDREAPSPFGPKDGPDLITPGLPTIDARGGGSISPDGPNLIQTLLEGLGLFNRLKMILLGSIFK